MSLHADRLSRLRGIYFVTDDRMSDAHQVREVVGAALRSGVRVIQLRDKRLPKAELIALAKQLREDTDAFDALLIINDYVDVAQLSNADGVHLGPDDISPARARELLGENALIGISAGSIEEMEAYGDTSVASYFGCGPVYGSKTKHDAGRAIGVERVALMRDTYPQLPIIAIGGITAENIGPLANLKINGAAVVSTISAAQNPEIAAQELVQLWH
jgi:thiamine-phosphate diphosphorylase